jgi:ribosomal protein L30/L7E
MADNKLDSLMDITLGAFQALQGRNPNIIAYYNEPPYAWVPDPCSRTLEFNDAVEPWNDKDLRWAVNYAIDRDEIVKVAYEGSTFPSRSFFPAYPPLNRLVDLMETKGLFDEYPLMKHDPAKAEEIIQSKGYTKNSNGIYVAPEPKVVFVIRVRGIMRAHPKTNSIMQLLRLRQIHNGVFVRVNQASATLLRLVEPYVTYGEPSLKIVRELIYKRGFAKVGKSRVPLTDNSIIAAALGKYGIVCVEDLIHEIYTCGPHFMRPTTSSGHSSSILRWAAGLTRVVTTLKAVMPVIVRKTSTSWFVS